MSISKNKPKEDKDNKELRDEAAFDEWTQDPNDKTRAATMRELLNLHCHVKEYIHMVIKENEKK